MSKKLNNDEWDEFIKEYYDSGSALTINEYCREYDVSKQQFHYHKKRLRESAKADVAVFHKVILDDETSDSNKLGNKSNDIKITIGNVKMDMPVSETTLIAEIIKELSNNVKC